MSECKSCKGQFEVSPIVVPQYGTHAYNCKCGHCMCAWMLAGNTLD